MSQSGSGSAATGAVVAGVLALGLAPAAARADVRRGVEARPDAVPGRTVATSGASGGEAVRLRPVTASRAWTVRLQGTPAVRLRIGGCRGRVAIRIGSGRPRVVRVSKVLRTLRLASTGEEVHRIRFGGPVAAARGPQPCRSLLVDRADVEARAPRLGTAVRRDFLDGDEGYRRLLAERFDAVTPENELKMETVQPTRGVFSFAAADALVGFARDRGMPVRGHTLVYDRQLPSWLTHPTVPWTRETLLAVLREHISTVVGRYRGRVDRWDVVNEAVAGDGTVKPTIWRRVIGPDYVDQAFRFARAADPGALLLYNDHTIERPAAHQRGVLRMVEGLRSRGVPIDGVGLQAHVSPDDVPTPAELDATLSRFADLGLRVEVTEADVALPGPATPASIAAQAATFGNLAAACWEHAACDRMTVWGVDDGRSWRGPAPSATLIDASGDPKPAYDAVRRALAGRPPD